MTRVMTLSTSASREQIRRVRGYAQDHPSDCWVQEEHKHGNSTTLALWTPSTVPLQTSERLYRWLREGEGQAPDIRHSAHDDEMEAWHNMMRGEAVRKAPWRLWWGGISDYDLVSEWYLGAPLMDRISLSDSRSRDHLARDSWFREVSSRKHSFRTLTSFWDRCRFLIMHGMTSGYSSVRIDDVWRLAAFPVSPPAYVGREDYDRFGASYLMLTRLWREVERDAVSLLNEVTVS